MGIAQTQNVEKDPHVLLPNNPFVPPQGDVCFINNLPPELLSRIFEVGAADNDRDNEDEGDMGDFWEKPSHSHLSEKDTDDGGVEGEDADTEEEEDEDEEETDEEDSDTTESSDFPSPWPPFQTLASHVCRHWRNVALSTPSLWTTIIVSPEIRAPYEPISTLLKRSGGLPIDISVNCESDCDYPSDQDILFLYNLLTPHVHRWRTIEVTVPEYHHMFQFLSAVSHPSISAAPQLTTLQLYHHEDTEEFDNFGFPSLSEHFVLFGGSAPCLTSVVLWGVHVDWDQPWIASASKLTDLELAYHTEDIRPTWTQFATILRGASSLEKLSLPMSGPSGDPAEWITEPTPKSPIDLNAPVQLPKLTDFVLAFHSPVRAIGLLHKLALPALKNLILDFDDDDGDYTDFVNVLAGPATSLSPPSAREQPRSLLSNLESLKLAGLPCRTECVQTLYGELQNLTSLNISLSHLSQQFIHILYDPCTLAGRSGVWLPRLTTLYVSGTDGLVLRDVVEGRRNAGAPLESLFVEELCDLNKDCFVWLRENLKTFELFTGSDDEDDDVDFEDLHEGVDEW